MKFPSRKFVLCFIRILNPFNLSLKQTNSLVYIYKVTFISTKVLK